MTSLSKVKAVNFIDYIIALLFVLQGNSVWTAHPDSKFGSVLFVILFFLIGVEVIFNNALVHKKSFISFCVLGVYLSVYIFFARPSLISYFFSEISFLLVLLFFYFAKRGHGIDFLYKYENIMLIVSCISLFFWIFAGVLNIIEPTGYFRLNWGAERLIPSYFGIYFDTQWSKEDFIRNCCFFTETPIFSWHLSLALLIESVLRMRNWRKIGLLLFAIFSTHSTTGYILAIFVVTYLAFFMNKRYKQSEFLMTIGLLLVPIALIAIYVLFVNKLNSSSGQIRVDDFVIGFLVWNQNKIFGAGYGDMTALQAHMGGWRTTMGFANSPLYVLATGGIYISALFFFPFIYHIKKCVKYRNWNICFFTFGLLYLFITTVVPSFMILHFILLMFVFDKNFPPLPIKK